MGSFSLLSLFLSFLSSSETTTFSSSFVLLFAKTFNRGTSTEDGLGLSWAISEYLILMPCYTLFTTHFSEVEREEKKKKKREKRERRERREKEEREKRERRERLNFLSC